MFFICSHGGRDAWRGFPARLAMQGPLSLDGRCQALSQSSDGVVRHAEELDMKTLLWTRGERFPLEMLACHVRWPRCGQDKARVMWTIPGPSQRTAVPSGG